MSLWEKERCGNSQCSHNRHKHGYSSNKENPYGKGKCTYPACPCKGFQEREVESGEA